MSNKDRYQKIAREERAKAEKARQEGDREAAKRHDKAAKQADRVGNTNPLRGRRQ